jgi:signal transduction histidine kinase
MPGKGTGLGLYITYNIIKEHKGELEFLSENGKGTTVRIIFPIK